MPQASAELHQFAMRKFGTIDDWTIWTWLESRGYTQHNWVIMPTYKSGLGRQHPIVPIDEADAIDFLCDEWDWSYDFRPLA